MGTGTGIWACEFGDEFPGCEVTGVDVSPMQPVMVPPNVKFEVDNAEDEWTWPDNTFDYIHLRGLLGSIKDWDKFYRQAYRCLKPGGWIEHHDQGVRWFSESGAITEESALGQYPKVFWKAGELMGQTFRIVDDDVPRQSMGKAGFANIDSHDFRMYYGLWPTDRRAKAIGNCSKMTFEQDPEGIYHLTFASVLVGLHTNILLCR